MILIYQCSDCAKQFLIHNGSPLNLRFGQLPEKIAQADNHRCAKRKKAA